MQFVDAAKEAVRYLDSNVELLGAAANAEQGDVLSWINNYTGEPFDVLFLDPPFRKGLLSDVLKVLAECSLLSPNALIYIEAEKELGRLDVPPKWQQEKHKEAGQVAYYLYAVSE